MIFNRLLLPPSSLLHPLLQPTTLWGTAEEIAKLLNQITLMKIEESQPLVNLIRYSKDILMYYNPSFQTHFCTLWDLNQYIIYLLRRVDNTLRFASRILHCFLIFCMILSSTLTQYSCPSRRVSNQVFDPPFTQETPTHEGAVTSSSETASQVYNHRLHVLSMKAPHFNKHLQRTKGLTKVNLKLMQFWAN